MKLIDGLIAQGAKDLTVVNNNAGNGDTGLAALLKPRAACARSSAAFRARPTAMCSTSCTAAASSSSSWCRRATWPSAYAPPAPASARFFSPTGYGTELAKGKETREIDGKGYVLEMPIHGDVALIKAERGDRWGNLTYRKAARNFGPVMATAAKHTVATVHEIVELGELDPEAIVTPGIYVSKIVKIERAATQAGGFKKAA